MKNKIFIFLFIVFILITMSACSTGSESTIYDVSGNNFKIYDYDFEKYTNINLQGHTSNNIYGFSAKVKCSQPLVECTAVLKFYSSKGKLLASETVIESNLYDSNDIIELTATIDKNIYEETYKIDIVITGKSKEKQQNTNSASYPITLRYYNVSFLDGSTILASGKYKSDTLLAETEFVSPNQSGHVFYGWYLDKQLTKAAVFPVKISNDVNLYASWAKTKQTISCGSVKLKNWTNYPSKYTYSIAPTGFDYNKLEKLGYNVMRIKLTYDVYYEKDYDVPFDVGYAGAPKYSFCFTNSTAFTLSESKLTTSESKKQNEYETAILISAAKSGTWYLEFSTENIQNIVHVENIMVEYEFIK